MKSERFNFPGGGGQKLAARLDLPTGKPLATGLFAHCFTCSKDILAARLIASRLTNMGLAVLRFDFTGLGHSEGEFANTTFKSNVHDLSAAARALAARGLAPALLVGHSLGGAAVLRAAAEIESVRAVATIGAPFDPAHVANSFRDSIPRIEADGRAQVSLGGRPFVIGREFLHDVAAAEMGPAIAGLKRALLVMHAPRDQVVGIDNAAEIFAAARHPKSFVTLDDADHLLSKPADAVYAADVIAAWSARYLDLAAPEIAGAPEGLVRVSEADPARFLQHISSGPHHRAVADEPLAYGGSDQGMSPYGFVAAGLGACTSMTIRMYARRKQWPLDHVSVDVTHDKVHKQDAEAGNAKVDLFRRVIRLEGDLAGDQRARLLEIADKCPVHRTLEQSSVIETVAE